jgi:hypothetical protein
MSSERISFSRPPEGELGFSILISLGDFLEELREASQNQPSYHARKITVKETLAERAATRAIRPRGWVIPGEVLASHFP